MGFLIDTNLWIAVERGRIGAADIHAITQQAPVFLSPVNLAEICFGIELMSDKKHRQRALAMLRPCAANRCSESPARLRRSSEESLPS